jgi:hypothetical protein
MELRWAYHQKPWLDRVQYYPAKHSDGLHRRKLRRPVSQLRQVLFTIYSLGSKRSRSGCSKRDCDRQPIAGETCRGPLGCSILIEQQVCYIKLEYILK